jgi:D-alanyl-D-alanine carboxypeptidase
MMPDPHPPEPSVPRLTEGAALEDLTGYVEESARRDQFSGVVLIARSGRILFERGWGLADREPHIPVTVGTKFNIASVNKMLTATAVLQLIEGNKLGFDDTVVKHLPGYANRELAQKVTIRHLMTHTGGTGNIFGDEYSRNRTALREHEDYVKLFQSRPLVFEPGSEYQYSNYGFLLLGRIIELVSGVSYDEYLQSKIFAPAGMGSTGAWPQSESVSDRALGYTRREAAWVSNADVLPWRGMAFGFGYSTAGDQFQFGESLQAGRLISKGLLAEATVPQRERTGYGFAVGNQGPLRYFGHRGGSGGANVDVRIFPELGYTLIAMSNLDPPSAECVLDRFMNQMPLD